MLWNVSGRDVNRYPWLQQEKIPSTEPDHRGEQNLRLRGNLMQFLGLGEDSASLAAEVNLEIAQGLVGGRGVAQQREEEGGDAGVVALAEAVHVGDLLEEDAEGARRAGIRRVILPRDNQKDLSDLPDQVRGELAFVLAERIEQVLEAAIPGLSDRLAEVAVS